MNRSQLTLSCLIFVVTTGVLFSSALFGMPGKFRVTVLVNEGILLQSGKTSILIDAFTDNHENEEGEAPALQELKSEMQSKAGPFEAVRLALISHPHREHFIASEAVAFLRKHPETTLISTTPVISRIKEEAGNDQRIAAQLRAIEETPGQIRKLTIGDIAIDFMVFKHEASMFYNENVLGFILDIDGRKILHVGDAEMQRDNWKNYGLKGQHISLAFVPFWLFKEQVTRDILREFVAPEKLAVVQILSQDHQRQIPALAKKYPGVVFLSKMMSTAEF